MQNILDMLNTEKDVLEDKKYDIENEVEKFFIETDETDKKKHEEDYSDILNMVFDDTFIKAESSPFMTYPDDKQEFLGRTNFVDLGKAIQQYRNGEIEERMLRVLDIIVHHKYISTRQIWQMYLLRYGLFIKRDNLKRLLNRMAEKGLVVEFIITSSMGGTNYRIYCPDYNGVRLYTALTSDSVNWKRTDTLQKPYIVKRSLAKNQFLVAYLKYYDIDYKLQPKLVWNGGSGHELAVVPALQLTFKLKEQLDSIVFLVEVIRTYHGWEEKYSEKLLRYGQYMKSVEDTQALKKYYIIICAESPEQVKEAAQIFYKLRHIKKIQDIRTLKLFYTYDLELLDNHIKTNLLDNLRSLEYNYDKNVWEECRLDFVFEQRDWHNIGFEIEKVHAELLSNVSLETDTEEISNDKQKLAIKIYNIVKKQGWEFPQSVTRLAIPLKIMGIDYKKLGYKKLKELFEDISEYYSINYESPTEMMISCSKKFNDILEDLNLEGQDEIEHLKENEVGKASETEKGVLSDIKYEKNIIADYFTNCVKNNGEHKKAFTNDVYCFKNWEVSTALIIKMTRIYDLSKDGWLNILAYSYCLAKRENRVIYNASKTYMYFDTGLLTFSNEKIYLLAKKNYREKPEWILEGLSTVNSKVLGEILKKEFEL